MERHRRPDLHRGNTSATTIAREHQRSREGSPSDGERRFRRIDIFLFSATLFSLAWPWAFFGTATAPGGVALPRSHADYVVDNPQRVSTFVAFVGSVYRIICAILFTFVIERFAQEWVRGREGIQDPISVFDVSVLLAFRHKSFVWEISEYKDWKVKGRWMWVALLVLYTTMLAMIPTGIVALIAPGPYIVSSHITGAEVDFSSNDSACLLEDFDLSPADCRGRPSKASWCHSKELPDMFSSVIDKVTTLQSNKSGIISMTMIGGVDSVRFLGPSRGVLPMGPGAPANDNRPNHFFNASSFNSTEARIRSFNYTLQQQGLSSNTSCKYSESSPITVFSGEGPGGRTTMVNGTCDASLNLTDLIHWSSIRDSPRVLAAWACDASLGKASDLSYVVYLRQHDALGSGNYNITCTSPIGVSLVDTTFDSSSSLFRTDNTIQQPTKAIGPGEHAMVSGIISSVIHSIVITQNREPDMFMDQILAAGVTGFGLAVGERNDQYLRLYEAMLDGLLEYQVRFQILSI
ncbi:hypothetical protein EST38_g2858 [Candolleomyces aberdarensis]|uniref:Uncharacterized protein n=1 Tax=Candolleomyces aberdarensis TaxID=2316362 RepID=A0A4Q2DTI1_9AGAR|nr:hypothetical protein EST38_g2858 [Candolleomyces aberdarensis]